jgi:hypothetical protein
VSLPVVAVGEPGDAPRLRAANPFDGDERRSVDGDAECVAAIIDWLTGEYERLYERAISRGWEISG